MSTFNQNNNENSTQLQFPNSDFWESHLAEMKGKMKEQHLTST